MRCRKHLNDYSNNIGVCASCLRERLFYIIAAQDQENRRTTEQQPPPLVFPRSVSPYVCRRKSDSGDFSHDKRLSEQLFFSTPQVRPTTSAFDATTTTTGSDWKRKNSIRPFSFLRRLFRSKSDKNPSDSVSNPRDSYAASSSSSSSSPSWFAKMLSSKRNKKKKNKSRMFSLDVDESTGRRDGGGGGRTMTRYRDRGMSPVRGLTGGVDEEEWSGYSSESSSTQGYKNTPRKVAQSSRRNGMGRTNHSLNVSGLNFCLSPLVRASPSRQWSQKGIPSEIAFSGELKLHVPNAKANSNANAASFRPSRSRKLTDFGRSNHTH